MFAPVYTGAEQPAGGGLEVTTTYAFGPGRPPVITWEGGEGGGKGEVVVRSKGKVTRSRWFEWGGGRYEWRYVGRRNGDGMLLQRVVPGCGGGAPPVVVMEKEKEGGRRNRGKEEAEAEGGDVGYVTVAEFARDEAENKRWMGLSSAGQGGWVSVYETEGEGEGQGLPEWLVLTTCMVMLKREKDRRNIQVAMMTVGVAGGS